MADSRGSALLQRWAGRARERAARNPRGGQPGRADSPVEDTPPALGTRLVGSPTPVIRIAAVPARTLVLVRVPGHPTVVRYPAELLAPRLLSPGAVVATAVAVSTASVHLDLTVSDLLSFDGYRVDPVTVRLELQLDDRDGYAVLVDQLDEHGDELERVLLEQVRQEGAAAVRGSVAMNRRADLERLGLPQVLGDRWLPRSFAGGLLLRRHYSVIDRSQPVPEEAEPTAPVLVRSGTTTGTEPAAARP